MKLFEMKHIKKSFGALDVLRDISLEVDEGEVLSIIGPSGSGKSTLLRCATGLETPDGGEIIKNGKIGLVFQNFNLFPHFSVIKNITDAPIKVQKRDKKEVYVDTLSRGMKQRLCVARALIHNPSLLVLDEPNSGLDPRARVEMKELLQNLRSMGKTIVISSHILSELAEMCNSIGIMDHGKLVEAGNIEDVMEHVFGGNRIVVSVHGEMEPAVRMLKEHPQIKVESVGEKEIHISHAMKEEEIAQLIAQMIQNGIIVTGFYKEEGNLESLFMQLTGGQEDEN